MEEVELATLLAGALLAVSGEPQKKEHMQQRLAPNLAGALLPDRSEPQKKHVQERLARCG